MKLITFAVPCYNSQDYMRHCIESLLVAGEDAEIIIVNDGSKDNTAAIADEYAEKYPSIVKVIHKENGGHGSGVNAGLKAASGLYYKVVDSDDWLLEDGLKKLVATIREHVAINNLPDMYITNFIYYHAPDDTSHLSAYTKKMNEGFVDWKKVKRFHGSHTLMMHALTYNTQKLRENYIELPKKTFYVDNLYAFAPLNKMLNTYYLNVDLYKYYIGRSDQSVNINNCLDRYKQQLLVMKMMITSHKYDEIKCLPKGLKNYMMHYLHAIMMNTLLFTCGKCSKERKQDLKEMWAAAKSFDKKLYRKVRYTNYPLIVAFMPWRIRGKIMMFGYKILCKRDKLGA